MRIIRRNNLFYFLASILSIFVLGVFAYTSSAAGPFARSLRLGSRGEDVRLLQQTLAKDPAIYPEGLVTGYFGSLTEMAVKRFQAKSAIVMSGDAVTTGFGVVGPRTIVALNASVSSARPSSSPTPSSSPSPLSLSSPAPSQGSAPRILSTDCNQAPAGLGRSYCWQTQAFLEKKPALCAFITATTFDLSVQHCIDVIAHTFPLALEMTLAPTTYKIGDMISGQLRISNTAATPSFTSLHVILTHDNIIKRERTTPLIFPKATSSVADLSAILGSPTLLIPQADDSLGSWTLTIEQIGTHPLSSITATFTVTN